MKVRWILWRVICLLSIILFSLQTLPVHAEELTTAELILEEMSAEERVGQLFLVTFEGMDVGEDSRIYQLITEHHIGGVVLLAENDNFYHEDTVERAQELINEIQRHAWNKSAWGMTQETSVGEDQLEYIPLLVGLKQIGNGFPGDQILSGLTSLPSQMAVGASWDLDHAASIGEVMGEELAALGINLYLGPNMDVLETANRQASLALGVNAYGGDPFWVGEMTKAYIRGLRAGSENQMLVIAQNFPGTGNTDRLPGLEVATVRKSLEQLKQIELAPYFAVTNPPVGDPSRVDGVMVAHIRYQGFQGNIRATTRPISFDSNALQLIMELPQFLDWRESGGLLISDNLGSSAVRRFFETEDTVVDARQIARYAFQAGNDMLYIDDLVSTGDEDAFTSLQDTITFFVQKYREDPVFARRVDASVLRILEAKLGIFGDFHEGVVVQAHQAVDAVGQSEDISFDIAQNAVTLISPDAQELDGLVPSPPRWYEDIVVITDARPVSQCDTCPLESDISVTAFASALVDLYGPQAGGLVLPSRVTSYSFLQLLQVLDNVESEINEAVTASLRSAEWIIFNTQMADPAVPSSFALQRILEERPDLLNGKNVIVFSMDLPTYLDATDISKVTAYYALYSKISPFMDVAARVLMQELEPSGALPVSLGAVGYDLISITAPDPNQIIPLELVLPEVPEEIEQELPEEEDPQETPTPEATPTPSFEIGDMLSIRTGLIYDHNQNIVPDGTIVRFNFRISGEPDILQQFETTTVAGRAYFDYPIETAGSMEVSVTSEPATQSETLQITIESDGTTVIFAFTPTPLWTPTPEFEATPTPTEEPIPVEGTEETRNSYPTLGEWALGVIVMSLGGGLTFLVGYLWWGTARWGLRSSLCAVIGSLLAYTYLNLGIDGTRYWIEQAGTSFVVEMIVVGLLIGWIGALIWWMRTEGRRPSRKFR